MNEVSIKLLKCFHNDSLHNFFQTNTRHFLGRFILNWLKPFIVWRFPVDVRFAANLNSGRYI